MIKFTKNFYQKGVRKKVISLGLDSGSSMPKAVLFKDDHIIKTKMIPTSISPRKSLEELYLDRFYKMLPYIISLLVLAVSSKKSRAPKAEGIPYDKGQR